MKPLPRLALLGVLLTALAGPATPLMSQSTLKNPEADRWLEKTPRPAPFQAPASLALWQEERVRLRGELTRLLGAQPPRPARLEVRTVSREDRGDYILERFEFDNGAGATVPGCLLLPAQRTGPVPAILYHHWHGGDYPIGKEELFQTRHTPEAPGPALVRRGYAVLAIDAYCFGERSGRGPGGPEEKGSKEELSASKYQLWAGRSLWGMMVRDDQLALDYLLSRPEVDKSRVGATGISMGATRTWWLMALDERIRAGVAVACLTRYEELIRQGALAAHGIYYFVPGMLPWGDTEQVVALAAPRPLLCLNGDSDSGSPVDGIRLIDQRVQSVYRLYGQEKAWQSRIYPKTGHVYLPDMWQRMLSWMDDQVASPGK